MNTDSVLQYLYIYLNGYRYHKNILGEIKDIITASGKETAIFRLLVVRLKQLSTMGIDATKLKEFENLGQGLYSMHISSNGYNIRILYSFLPNKMPCLLLAFYEREGKRKTDYTHYLEPAKNRLKSMKEDFDNEPYKI